MTEIRQKSNAGAVLSDANARPLRWIFLGCIGLTLCWSNINTGFWNLEGPVLSFGDFVFFIRAVLPFVLPVFFIVFYFTQDRRLRSSCNPCRGLLLYGIIALFSSLFSPMPYVSFYWGMAYMMSLFSPAVFFCKPFSDRYFPEDAMLRATWGILFLFIFAMLLLFGMRVVQEREILATAESAGAGLATRSSGLGRFFGAAAAILAVRFFQGKGWSRFLLLIPILFCLRVVWVAQSRGAMFAVLFSFIVIVLTTRTKWLSLICMVWLVIFGLSIFYDEAAELEDKVIVQFQRGQSKDEFVAMTGRTRAYRYAWEQIQERPLLGAGQWADRLLIHEHSHNSYLQALLNAGFLGAVPYLFSWITALVLSFKIYTKLHLLTDKQKIYSLQCIAVTVFFLIRSIPETTTASFSVDQMIMVPVFYYLTVIFCRLKEKVECLRIQGK